MPMCPVCQWKTLKAILPEIKTLKAILPEISPRVKSKNKDSGEVY